MDKLGCTTSPPHEGDPAGTRGSDKGRCGGWEPWHWTAALSQHSVLHTDCHLIRTGLPDIPYLMTVQSTQVSVFNFYRYSAVRYNKLKQLRQVMGHHVKQFKKPTLVKYLPLQDSILAMISAWSLEVSPRKHVRCSWAWKTAHPRKCPELMSHVGGAVHTIKSITHVTPEFCLYFSFFCSTGTPVRVSITCTCTVTALTVWTG